MSSPRITETPGDEKYAAPSAGLAGLSGWRKWLLLFAGWTLLGLAQAARLYYWYNWGAECLISWAQAIVWALAEWYLWALLSLVIFRIASRISFDRKIWWRSALIHLFLAIVFSLIHLLLYTAVFRPLGTFFWHQIGTTPSFMGLYQEILRIKLHVAILTYLMIAFVCYAINYHNRFRNEESRLAQVEASLSEARLAALKMQLHPHFLFNTLNTVASKIHTDPQSADRMITELSDLLRITLEHQYIHKVTLQDELKFLDHYLEIQQIRFTDRLRVHKDIAPETLAARVPSLILQPLVENAMRHGISHLMGEGHLRLSARRDGEFLRLEVADNGPGMGHAATTSGTGGHGLANTHKRLQQHYGSRYQLELQDIADGGVRAVMVIPFEIEPQKQSTE